MKARVGRRLRAGRAAKLEFTPPDGGAPIDVLGLVVRVDGDSAAFWFLDLMTHDADRLNTLVERLQASSPGRPCRAGSARGRRTACGGSRRPLRSSPRPLARYSRPRSS